MVSSRKSHLEHRVLRQKNLNVTFHLICYRDRALNLFATGKQDLLIFQQVIHHNLFKKWHREFMFVSKSTPSFCLRKTYRMKREVIKSLPWTKYLAPPLYDQHNWKKVQMDPQNFTGILKILWNCLKQTSSGSCWGDKLSAKHLYDPRRILSIHSNSTFYKCLFNILSHPKNKIIVKITISVWNRVNKTHIEIKLGFIFIFHALLSY